MPDILANHSVWFIYCATYARWIVGGLLLVAGSAKARDIDTFVVTIHAFRLVPRPMAKSVAYLIVGVECILGSSLLVGLGVGWTAVAATALFGLFALAIFINLIRRNMFDCHCFGPYFRAQISGMTLLRSVVLLALCFYSWLFYDSYLALDAWFIGSTTLQGRMFAPFFIITAFFIVLGISMLAIRSIHKSIQPPQGSALRK